MLRPQNCRRARTSATTTAAGMLAMVATSATFTLSRTIDSSEDTDRFYGYGGWGRRQHPVCRLCPFGCAEDVVPSRDSPQQFLCFSHLVRPANHRNPIAGVQDRFGPRIDHHVL